MKIAIVTNLYPPYARGGAEVVITRTVTELLAQGHEVSVITSRPFGGFSTLVPHLEDKANEQIYRYYPLNIYHPLRDFKHPAPIRLLWHAIDMVNPLNGFLVRRLMNEIKPDVVWSHNLKGVGLTIPLFLRRSGLPWIHQLHDVQLSAPSGLIIAGKEKPKCCLRIFEWMYTRLCALLFDSPSIVISPSRFLRDFYQQRRFFKNSEVLVMPNPAPKIQTLTRGPRVPGPLRLLSISMLEEHKGIRFMMESLAKWETPFELTLAGEGTLGKWVREAAAKDKRFKHVGFLALDQIVKLFQISDALVVPSLCYENSPTVIYEALQAGVPVVAADIGGVAELIREGVNGYLFVPGDRQDLLATLRTIDQEKERLRADSDAIKATVADHAMDVYVRRLVELFEKARK